MITKTAAIKVAKDYCNKTRTDSDYDRGVTRGTEIAASAIATGIRALPAEDPVTIVINNPDAVDAHLTMLVDAASVANIIMWYGAFYAGDDYTVSLNGVAQKLDHNGEIVPC